MIEHKLLEKEKILIVSPRDAIEAADFAEISRQVDPFIEEQGELAGILIDAKTFPGWADFAALVSHLKFIRDHHHQVKRVAAVTDDHFLSFIPTIADHFVAAEVRHFSFSDRPAAVEWLEQELPMGGCR